MTEWPLDMFDETFKIAEPMKSTGKIQWKKEEVDFLSACIIQVDGAGKIIGAAYGVATKKPDRPNDFPIKNDGPIVNGEPQPTWKLTMRMVPGSRAPGWSARDRIGALPANRGTT